MSRRDNCLRNRAPNKAQTGNCPGETGTVGTIALLYIAEYVIKDGNTDETVLINDTSLDYQKYVWRFY